MQREIATQMGELQSEAGVSGGDAPRVTEDEEFSLAPADLLRSAWVPSISVIRNIRLLMSSVYKFVISQNTSTFDSGYLIDILTEAAKIWMKHASKNQDVTSADRFVNFLRSNASPDTLLSAIDDDLVRMGDFYELVRYHKNHIPFIMKMSGDVEMTQDQCVEDDKTDKRGGSDIFLEEFKHTANKEGFPQFIVKRSGDSLYALRSAGKEGQQMVRIQWYNTKDIKSVDRIDWWRHALLRAQFVIENEGDDKVLKLRQVLDSVFNEMRKSPGVTKDLSVFTDLK